MRIDEFSWNLTSLSETINRPTKEYKAAERKVLEDEGYAIIGNMGDQWRDLEGASDGLRVFKIPNPMYYIS